MKVIEYYLESPDRQKHWLDEIEKNDWDAGSWLHHMIKNNELEKYCGKGARVLLLAEDENLASFCTYVLFDEIDDDSMKPWIGFVYTYPEYRGRRCAGELIEYACNKAKEEGHENIFVSSEEKGLYEKYGFTFVKNMMSVHGYETGVFKRKLF